MEGDKPFKCPKCSQCFANSDHLHVHTRQHSLQVKIPTASSGDHVTDMTPTPTRFLKTAEVDGSQLFEDINCNPFDQDFRLATSTTCKQEADQNPSIDSTCDSKQFNQNEEQTADEAPQTVASKEAKDPTLKGDSKVTSTTLKEAIHTPPAVCHPSAPPYTALTPQIESVNEQNTSHDALREHLQALIKSGQIKIQFSSASSAKVQATIVGSVATKRSAVLKPVFSVVPHAPVSHTNENITAAKQKLKEVVQNNNLKMDKNGLLHGNRVTMVSNQGKYKDIVLESEDGEQQLEMGKRRARSQPDISPDEKRQRFLERNRAAASRCRQKRKVWVNQLEKKSDDLVQLNSDLMNEITNLRGQVTQLKSLLLAHKECPVTLQQKSMMGAYVTVSDGQIIAVHPAPTKTSTNGLITSRGQMENTPVHRTVSTPTQLP